MLLIEISIKMEWNSSGLQRFRGKMQLDSEDQQITL